MENLSQDETIDGYSATSLNLRLLFSTSVLFSVLLSVVLGDGNPRKLTQGSRCRK